MPPIFVVIPQIAEMDLETVFAVSLGKDLTGRDRGPAFRLEREIADCPVCDECENGGVSVLRYLGEPGDWTLKVWALYQRLHAYRRSHACTEPLRRLLTRLHGPPSTFRAIRDMHATYRREFPADRRPA